MIFKSYRDESRTNWGVTVAESTKPDRDQLHLGCMLRIADATEAMAQNYIALQRQRDEYKRWYEEEKKSNLSMCRRIASLKGTITKLKRRVITPAKTSNSRPKQLKKG